MVVDGVLVSDLVDGVVLWVDGKLVSKKKFIRFPAKEQILAAVRNKLEE